MTSICLVDDDENVREVFSMFIEENYPEVAITECGNGYEALDKIKDQKFDLLISDLKMPDMDGEELIGRLDQFPDTRPLNILILTGFLGEIGEGVSKQKNISFLTKPFKENVFKAYIRKNLKLIDKHTIDEANQKKMADEMKQNKAKLQQTGLNFIEPFIDVTINFLNSISHSKIKKKNIYIRKEGDTTNSSFMGEISTSIGLRSSHLEGSLGLIFKKETFLKINNQFNNQKETQLNQGNAHFLGQIIKKIMKETSKVLERKSFSIHYEGPHQVVFGENLNIHHFQKGPVLVTEFESDLGSFAMELLIKGK
jgi:CheY-like chemotaxis protein